MVEKIYKSKCCNAEIKQEGEPDFIGSEDVCTVHYVCLKCNEPCDIVEEEEKKIYCCECSKFLGIIRDAALRKKMEFVCCECREKWKARGVFDDIFGDLFRKK